MTEYRVVIPEERFCIVEFRQENLPGIAVIKEALGPFEPKSVFAWHLSVPSSRKGGGAQISGRLPARHAQLTCYNQFSV